jgi:hypothetical protein
MVKRVSLLKSSSACYRIIEKNGIFNLWPPTIGRIVGEWLDCPAISEEEVEELNVKKDRYITRHIKRKYLESTLKGNFRFGTLLEYRPKDENLIGRFSDVQEASQKNYYRSRSNVYNYYGSTLSMTDCLFIGYDYGMLIEFFCNDYCSCASRDSFHILRAINLRNLGNPDIGAYVVYDFDLLISAIQQILKEQYPQLSIIYKPVIYGKKDRHWHIEDHHADAITKDKIAIWLSTAFVKSVDYSHEEEIRIIIIDRRYPGGLSKEITELIFEDERIASSITDYGYF